MKNSAPVILVTALALATAPVRAEPKATAAVPAAWQSSVAKDIARSEYRFSVRDDGSFSAPNRAHDLRSTITPAGLELTAREEGASRFTLTLRLLGHGRGSRLVPAAAGTLTSNNGRAEVVRGAVREWYVNDERGLEQGFTIASPPGGRPADDAKAALEMTLGGDVLAYPDPAGQTILFKNATGEPVLRYTELHVVDASGRELPARMVVRPGVLRIEYDDEGALYPVTVDPLATSPAWTAESNQTNCDFGASVATAGDVNGDGYSDVIVGADYYDNGQAGNGAAFVFLGSATGLATSPAWMKTGAQADGYFGFSVGTAGDVNGDGYSDVIVGEPYYDNGETDDGRALVYLGSALGVAASPAWTAQGDQLTEQVGVAVATAGDVNGDGFSDVIVGANGYTDTETFEGGAFVYLGSAAGLAVAPAWIVGSGQPSTSFGYSVASAGDVNGDGYADVIVGAMDFANGETSEGRAFVYLGSAAGPATSPSWTAEIDQAGARFGISVATAGDVNGDGYADVIVGADLFDDGEVNEGGAFVFLGSASGLAASPAWSAESNQSGVYFGSPVGTAGDVNGDGYADVIVAAAWYSNGQSGEGKAYVYLGSASGPSPSPAWTAESDQADAYFGYSAATAGDVNGDGYSDVIVGAYLYDNDQLDEGRTYVYLGSASGPALSAGWTAESDQAGADFGIAVASAGDVNGDGFGDVVVGAYAFDGGDMDEGRAFVYLGSASGLAASPAWTAESDQGFADFGYAVSTAGDVNGDGYADVIVGAYAYTNGQSGEGRAFVYLGSASGLAASPAWTAESDQAGAFFGVAVATAGDVNGDGYADVIVGAETYDDGEAEEGGAFVYLGSASGLQTSPAWTAEGNGANARFGVAVASAGDVNGDGYSDVIVGAYLYSNDQPDEGRAFVYLGSASGLAGNPAWTSEGNQDSSRFGYSVGTAGDVNGDGYADVIVGAYGYHNPQIDEGRAYVYLGSVSGLAMSPAWTAESDQAGAYFGHSVGTAGDVNGDGYSDVIVGAYGYDNGIPEPDEGRALVYFGSASGLATSPAWIADSNQDTAFFGFSVATAGDVNGDGYSDVIAGAFAYDGGQADEGRAFLYYGNGGKGLSRVPRQVRSDHSAGISPLGKSDIDGGFRLGSVGRSPAGRDRVKLQWQVKPLGTPFAGTGIQSSAAANSGVPLDDLVVGLTPATPYTWRLRVASANPFFPRSPWLTLPHNGSRETDLRTGGPVAPFVTAVSPHANQLEVQRSTNVTVTFSEIVNAATVTSATFRLLDPLSAPVAAAPPVVSPSGLQATLNLTAPLAADTLYTVQVTSGVLDLAGIPAVPFTSRFRTESADGGAGTPLPDVSTSAPPPAASGSAEMGQSVAAAGDLNGDGIKDFISGAPGYATGSRFAGTSVDEAGAALVFFGSGSTTERGQPDIIFAGVGAHDRAGVSVASNFDFNGDGIRDIVIGAEQVDRATNPNSPAPTGSGKVYVIFFDPHDTLHYPHIADPTVPDIVSLSTVGEPGGIPGVVFQGGAFGDQAGFSVAAGGTSTPGGGTDILIGAPGADPGSRTDAGAAYVVFDNPALTGSVSLSRVSNGLPDQIPGKEFLGAAAGDNLGFSTAFAGPVVDGQSPSGGTVVIGAPGMDGKGTVMARPGDPDTTPIVVDAVGTVQPGVRIVGSQNGEKLGSSVAAGGDALVDGVPDLLVGAPLHDAGAVVDAGEVLQISAVLASGVYSSSAVGVTIAGVAWQGAAAGDGLGYAVAGVGDVTGDGYDDVVFGAPFADAGTIAEAGAVYVVNGQPIGLVGAGTISASAIGTTYAGDVFVGTTVGEHAGSALAGTGDLDGDGDPDFVVGAPGVDGQLDPNAGTTYAVVESEPPPSGNCGPGADCLVADLSNGAQLHAPAGTLAAPATIGVTGILDAASLPGPVPGGKLFLGAGQFSPEAQSFLSPYATVQVPTIAGLEAQLTNLESLPLSYWTGSTWTSAGVNGTVGVNPQYASRKAVGATANVLHVYAIFLNDGDGDAIRDERDNCPGAANPTQVDTDTDGIGDACDSCTDTDHDGFGNPGFPANTCPLDNCPSSSNPAQTDGDGDGAGNVCDNCPSAQNPSQDDLDGDSVGDACDTDPRVSVSNKASDVHDFVAIQAAVNAAAQSGTRIRILPGTGPYLEHVVVNRNFALIFEGVDDVGHTPVVVDGGNGIAFDVVTTSAGGRVSFDNLTIRGTTGIRSEVSSAMEDLTFEQATLLAVDLNGGNHTLTRIKMGSTVASGVDTAAGVSLALTASWFQSLTGTALRLGGPSSVDTVLVGGGTGDAVVMLGTGNLVLGHATIAGNGGKGVDDAAGAAVTIANAIVQDNAGGDVVNVACPSITWSNVKSLNCTGTGNDLQATCALGADFRQLVSSPCLDYGPSPATFTGTPCLDLDGGPRLRDHDGDGIATIDPGAFERVNATLAPADVPHLRFTSKTTLQWDAEGSGVATEYHVYRDLKSNLSYGNFGTCRDDLDANRTDLVLTDASSPPPGQAFVYAITAARPAAPSQPDREGTMGLDRCMERSNFSPCP